MGNTDAAARTHAGTGVALPNELGAAEAAREIKAGRLRAADMVAACVSQIERWDPSIHAWVTLSTESAMRAAAVVDARVREGQSTGPLAGVPVGVKDIFNTIDMPTQMGSPIWTGFTPGNDARVVHYLRMADAIIPGKTVTAEFAVHAPGPTENPHRAGFMPGTSSSGSAAAVAAYMVPVALGTQTAGSIIRPASYCGVFGFKPSFGLVPRTGMLKTTDSLDTVGCFARNVEDLELVFETIRVKGADYPIGDAALNDPARQERASGRPWRIALLRGPKWNDAETYVRGAVEDLAHRLAGMHGIEVEEPSYPAELDEAHEIHSIIYDRALAYYFKEEYRQHTLVSQVIYDIIDRGNRLTPDEYRTALRRQTETALAMERFFLGGFDLVLDMATAGEALPGLESVDRPDNALVWTLCGLPALSLPLFAAPNGLPFGAQIAARKYNDRLLLSFARDMNDRGMLPAGTNPPLRP